MTNTPQDDSHKKKSAILEELESVQALLSEAHSLKEDHALALGDFESRATAALKSLAASTRDRDDFQIPLLDYSRSTNYELDFPKSKLNSIPEKKISPSAAESAQDIQVIGDIQSSSLFEEDIPVLDDIQSSSSMFDEQEYNDKAKPSLVTEKELTDKAQLIIQDLINTALTELEEKLDDLLPNLEERLKKTLEKAMDDYIAKALKKS